MLSNQLNFLLTLIQSPQMDEQGILKGVDDNFKDKHNHLLSVLKEHNAETHNRVKSLIEKREREKEERENKIQISKISEKFFEIKNSFELVMIFAKNLKEETNNFDNIGDNIERELDNFISELDNVSEGMDNFKDEFLMFFNGKKLSKNNVKLFFNNITSEKE